MIVWLQIISLLAQKQLLFLVFMTSWNVALDLTLTLLFDARILIKLGSSSVASFLLTANILDLLNWFPIHANELMCTVNGFIVTSYPKCPEWVFDINQILWYSESFNIVLPSDCMLSISTQYAHIYMTKGVVLHILRSSKFLSKIEVQIISKRLIKPVSNWTSHSEFEAICSRLLFWHIYMCQLYSTTASMAVARLKWGNMVAWRPCCRRP